LNDIIHIKQQIYCVGAATEDEKRGVRLRLNESQ
jgi:hypothetical protein